MSWQHAFAVSAIAFSGFVWAVIPGKEYAWMERFMMALGWFGAACLAFLFQGGNV